MKIGVPKETAANERRVALVPDAVGRLVKTGLEVAVEQGAGAAAAFPDDAYRAAGAGVVAATAEVFGRSDVVLKVQPPSTAEVALCGEGAALVAVFQPAAERDVLAALAARKVTAFSLALLPRITRAQPMDVLSSQATVAGYKAVLLAATTVGRLFPMLVTAAGTLPPARVLVLGAGVAGLQAIATARRLGAVVSAFDVRPVVKEQVESLGATFLDLGVRGEETEGGYATELTPEQQRQQQEALAARIPDFDVVITTALIPGRPAPKLIPAAAARAMRPGSVIVDLAAEAGGNCELTSPGAEAVREDVTILGFTNLPSTMPYHASQLYSRNVTALLQLLVADGELKLDWSDEIVAGACVAGKQEVAA